MKASAKYLKFQARFTKISDRVKSLEKKIKANVNADPEYKEALAKLRDPKIKLDRKESDQLRQRIRKIEHKYRGLTPGYYSRKNQ